MEALGWNYDNPRVVEERNVGVPKPADVPPIGGGGG